MSVNAEREINLSGDEGIPNNLAVKLQIFLFEIHDLNLKRNTIKVLFVKNWQQYFSVSVDLADPSYPEAKKNLLRVFPFLCYFHLTNLLSSTNKKTKHCHCCC